MDPVSAFSLAAGAVSVLDVGFRALSTCREIYQNGCLSEHRDTQEITEQLLETTKQLENSVRDVSTAGARQSEDVVEVSEKCSETATELLSELRKLQQDPKGGFRQIISRSLRTMRKKQYLAKTQHKLEREGDILNTRILAKLDHNTVLQMQNSSKVNQNVKDLAVALSQGRNTFQQLLAHQTILIQKHVDRRLEEKAIEEEVLKTQQKFKNSLFFPEMFARQENISWSHEGTCKWIFGAPYDENDIHSDSECSTESSDFGYQYEYAHESKPQPWSSFKDWLEDDSNDPYWLSGKPGSGKSTLMKYISTEFDKFCHSRTSLFLWRDAIMCFFCFWNLGSSLQKNYAGFLRSLLFQIAEQRADMIPVMRDDARCRNVGFSDSTLLYAWTEHRLEDALKRFLAEKEPLMRVCMFIDGLDEFVGDEDRLIEIIRLLSRTSGIKVCVSSRPEQIYRQGFATSPKLRLQDLNHHDIWKATAAKLIPALQSHTSCSNMEVRQLVQRVTDNSHGVFLWAELMTKDLKAGARNADSIVELADRLDRTPETVEGLYEYMLNRLDRAYLREAAKYFSHLMAHQECSGPHSLQPTLLEFACSDENPWFNPIRLGSELIAPASVVETCRHLEIRILTRCAGLVEVEEKIEDSFECVQSRRNSGGYDWILPVQEDNNYTRCLREVGFIHRTAEEFLKTRRALFDDPDWELTGRLAAVRGRIAVASLAPEILVERRSHQGPFTLQFDFMADLMNISQPSDSCSQEIRDAATQTVEDLYNLLRYLNAKFDGPSTTMVEVYYERLSWHYPATTEPSPVYDCLSFASFFGRDDYVAQYMAENCPSQADFERVLACAVLGMSKACWAPNRKGFFIILRDNIKRSTELNLNISYATNKLGDYFSMWAVFVHATCKYVFYPMLFTNTYWSTEQRRGLMKVWSDVTHLFLNNKASPNVMLVYELIPLRRHHGEIRIIETPLALLERRSLETYGRRGRVFSDEFEILLKDHGGINRRSILSIGKIGRDQHPLTEDQSNRLIDVLSETIKRLHMSEYVIGGSSGLIESMPSQPDPRAEKLVTLMIEESRYRAENPDWDRTSSHANHGSTYLDSSLDGDNESNYLNSSLDGNNECSLRGSDEDYIDDEADSL